MMIIDIQPRSNIRFSVMMRDRRLTGYLRGQTDQVVANPGFEVNKGWQVSPYHSSELVPTLTQHRLKTFGGNDWHKVKKSATTC